MIYEKFYYSLNVNFDNELDESKSFIKNLEHNLKKIISLSTEINNNLINKKLLRQSNIKYIPEKIIFSSPLTLFEGPKFSGKTTFMESICNNISDNKIRLSYINKIKIINLLNYFPFFQSDVSSNLLIDDILDVVDNSEVKNSIYEYLSTFSEKDNINKLNISLDLITKINKQINKPVLFIVDNIEKIESNLEVILWTINRLSFINNFVFLFIVNGNFNKFTTDYSSEKEKSISKNYKKLESFVNLPIYKFNQDYTCLLNKYDLDSSLIKNLNDILVKNDDYVISLKELDAFLTSIIQNDNQLNKYKLLASFYNLFPWTRNQILDIIVDYRELFSKGLKNLKVSKDNRLSISKKIVNKLHNLNRLIYIDKSSDFKKIKNKNSFEEQFKKVFLDGSYDNKWAKYNNILLDVNKKIDLQIMSVKEEINSIQEQALNIKVLKSRKNKINNKNLYSTMFSDVDDADYEITSSENLLDQAAISNPEEVNKIKNKIKEKDTILKNINIIKENLNEYFNELKNNFNDAPIKIKQFLANKDFKDDISVLNKVFLDTKFRDKLLRGSNSYKELLKFRSLQEALCNSDSKMFDELIDFISSEMSNYIMDNYNKLN